MSEREREREGAREGESEEELQYLHGLRLVHGFDCILCHSSGGKRDKRTSCRGEDRGRAGGQRGKIGSGEEEEGRRERTKNKDKRVTHVIVL